MNQSLSANNVEELKHKGKILCAWGVHIFTAAGAVVGLCALIAFTNGQWILGIIWMAVAMAIDGCDGAMARIFNVKEMVPEIDGAQLDNMVDYFNYVIVPGFFMYQAELMPARLALPAIAAIALCSAYQFCKTDAKTEDHFFKGFPSYWNVIAFYALVLPMDPWLTFAVVVLCCILVFVPIRYIYPSRTRRFQALTFALTFIWGAAGIAMFFQYPNVHPALAAVSLAYIAYYILMSIFFTLTRRTAQ